MNEKKRRRPRVPEVARKAEKALRIAVVKTIEEHRRDGDPIVIWKNGRVVTVPASRIPRPRTAHRQQVRVRSTLPRQD